MQRHASVFAYLTVLPSAVQNVVLSPAQLRVLEGEDGCTAAERNGAVCSISLLQTQMKRRNTDPTSEGNDKVWENHRTSSAGAVEDLVHRADRIADTLKEVAEATESNGSKYPGEIDRGSLKTLEDLDETVGRIKHKANKLAAKMKDAAVFEDSSEYDATSKVGKEMHRVSVADAHILKTDSGAEAEHIKESNLASARHSLSKSLDDTARFSEEAQKHNNKKIAVKSLDNMAHTVDDARKRQTEQAATEFSEDVTRASEAALAHSNRKSATRSLEHMAHTSEEARKQSSTRSAAKKEGDARDGEQPGSSITRAKPVQAAAKVPTMASPDVESSLKMASTNEHGARSEKHSQHDTRSDDSVTHGSSENTGRRHDFEKHSVASDSFTAHSEAVISVKMEKVEDDFDDIDDSLCDPGRFVDFGAAELIHNNLGGVGPDTGEESIVYQGVASIDGAAVNLVVSALSPYTPYNPLKNGLVGPFGRINLQVETKVDLSFRFVFGSGGEDAPMHPFYFSFVDLDNGMAPFSAEKITVKGFESYRLSEDTEVSFKARGEDAATFSSSWRGGKVDNPANPMSMNKLERDRTVTAVFSNTSSFEVTFEESGYASVQGRNFLFAGVSDLVCGREQKCALYECPDGFHLRQTAEFLVCEGRRCAAIDRDLCCFALSS